MVRDRVDVLFDNHGPRRSVVEIELDGERNLEVGVHQAIKYRALAAVADRFELGDPTVRAYVAAFETRYPKVEELAHSYDVRLVNVDRSLVHRRVAQGNQLLTRQAGLEATDQPAVHPRCPSGQ